MKRFRIKIRGAVLLCCVTALLLPLSAYSQDSGKKSGDKESMQQQAGEMMEHAGEAMSDMRLHMMLETRLARNEHLSAMGIDTDVKNGKAYMMGEVETDAQRELATELAGTVDGITEVQNDLVVKSAEPGMGEKLSQQASDAALTARVKSRLLLSDNTSGLAINVDTADSIVTLQGKVDSDTERELAGLIAGNTPGVAEVNNKLELKSD